MFFFYYIVSLEPDFVEEEPCGCTKDPVPQCGCCDKFEFDGKDHNGKQFENKCCCIFPRQTLHSEQSENWAPSLVFSCSYRIVLLLLD